MLGVLTGRPMAGKAPSTCNLCCGIIIGLILFFGSFGLLWWNEHRSVTQYKRIAWAQENLVDVTSKCATPESGNNGKLVFSSGKCQLSGSAYNMTDPYMGYETDDAIYWESSVEVFQWFETTTFSTSTSRSSGRSTTSTTRIVYTTYSYDQKWAKHSEISTGSWDCDPNGDNVKNSNCECGPQSSPRKDCANPEQTSIKWRDAVARADLDAFYGGYKLTGTTRSVGLTSQTSAVGSSSFPEGTGTGLAGNSSTSVNSFSDVTGGGTTMQLPLSASNSRHSGNYFYSFPSTRSQKVGDMRYAAVFGHVSGSTFTVLMEQVGSGSGSSAEYTFQNKKNDEVTVGWVRAKTYSGPAAFIKTLNDEETALAWVLRFLGFFCMWFGLQLVFAPISAVPKLIPCIGEFISSVVGMILCCATCLLSTCFSFFIIAIAWLFARPVVGIPCLCVALLACGGAIYFGIRQKKKKEAAAAAAAANGDTGGYSAPAGQPQQGGGYPAPGGQTQSQQGGGYPAPGGQTQQGGGYPAPGGEAQQGGYPAPAGEAYPAPGGGGGYPAPGGASIQAGGTAGYPAPGGASVQASAYPAPGGAYPAPGGAAYPAPGGAYPAPGGGAAYPAPGGY